MIKSKKNMYSSRGKLVMKIKKNVSTPTKLEKLHENPIIEEKKKTL